jgi:hypothetical protein
MRRKLFFSGMLCLLAIGTAKAQDRFQLLHHAIGLQTPSSDAFVVNAIALIGDRDDGTLYACGFNYLWNRRSHSMGTALSHCDKRDRVSTATPSRGSYSFYQDADTSNEKPFSLGSYFIVEELKGVVWFCSTVEWETCLTAQLPADMTPH